jgi:hypothetical protein
MIKKGPRDFEQWKDAPKGRLFILVGVRSHVHGTLLFCSNYFFYIFFFSIILFPFGCILELRGCMKRPTGIEGTADYPSALVHWGY